MSAIFYYNWNGKAAEMYEWEKHVKKDFEKDAPKGVKLIRVYTSTIPRNRTQVNETDSVDKLMSTWKGS